MVAPVEMVLLFGTMMKFVADAAHWCVDNGYAKTYNGGVRSHISNAAKHKTKTAYGYRWEYAQ